MLGYRILGPLAVDRDGTAVDIVGQRQRTVLVLLLLEANHLVTSERLVDCLWGERPPPTAPTALRNAVSQLRKQLGSEAIETRPSGYVLRTPPESIDVVRFERALTAARLAAPADRLRLLREALAEWRESPLPDLAYEDALQEELRRLTDLHVAAEEELIEAELDAGVAAPLVPVIESLIARYPHRERLRAHLMLALYRSDRQADALQAYQAARRVLADDLGLEPGPALRRVHGAILRQEAALETQRPSDARPSTHHLGEVAGALLAGRLVAVVAAGADVAAQLAARFKYPHDGAVETPRVSQFAATLLGHGPLHDELRALSRSEPTPVHRFFASLPPVLRERDLPHQLLVTTDYDGALEQAFAEAGEQVDVVAYLAAGPDRGRFCHLAPDGSGRVIDAPDDYATELSLDRRTVILRVRGRADPTPDRTWESFVVTEDDHLDYLRRGDVAAAIPVGLAATLRRSHFLFLGYTARDWCLRLVLGRICAETPLAYRSWAVLDRPAPTEAELWRRLGVDLVESPLEPYVEALGRALQLEPEVSA